jgi:hypothetical protein
METKKDWIPIIPRKKEGHREMIKEERFNYNFPIGRCFETYNNYTIIDRFISILFLKHTGQRGEIFTVEGVWLSSDKSEWEFTEYYQTKDENLARAYFNETIYNIGYVEGGDHAAEMNLKKPINN